MSLSHSRVQSWPGVAARLLALYISDIFVAQRRTVLFAMTRFLPSRTEVWSLVASHCLTTCALVVIKTTLLTVRAAEERLTTNTTMRWVFVAPGDLAAFVLDIDAALGCVRFAVHPFATRHAKVRAFAATQVYAEFRHISALIIRHSVFPDILRGQPEEN